MYKNCLKIVVAVLFTLSANGQINKKFIDTGAVNNQFDYLYKKSNRYRQYKVVQSNWILKLRKNVADSLSASKQEINSNYNTINSQKASIDSLKLALHNSKRNITQLNSEIESISFFKIETNKGLFKTIMFSIIGALIVFLAIFIGRFKQSNSITKDIKNRLKETEEEFDNHRKVALEREQKVRRQLQDELNKQKKE